MWIKLDILIYPIYSLRWEIFFKKKSSFLSLSIYPTLYIHFFFYSYIFFFRKVSGVQKTWKNTFLLYYKSSSSKMFWICHCLDLHCLLFRYFSLTYPLHLSTWSSQPSLPTASYWPSNSISQLWTRPPCLNAWWASAFSIFLSFTFD